MSNSSTVKRLSSDAFWVILGQALSACALLAGTRILTELVSPDVYGQVALMNGFVALGVALFSYPFICAGMRLWPECQNQGERDALYAVIKKLITYSTTLAICLLALGGGIYRYFSHISLIQLLLVSLLLGVTIRRELGIQLLIGEREQRRASFWQTSDSVFRPLFAVLLVWWGDQKVEFVLLGYILASLLSNLIWSVVYRIKTARAANTSLRSFKTDVWAYALPLIPMEMIFWINGLGDRYIIGYYMSAAEVGLYAATYLIINEAFNRSAMVLLRTFQPAYFQACSREQAKESIRILWLWLGYVIALGLVGVFLVCLTKDWIAAFLLAKSYHAAIELMPAIALGCSLHALGTVISQPLLAKKRTRFVLLGRFCGAVTALVSIPLMVKHFGLLGAAMANPIYFGIETFILALLAKPWRNVVLENNALQTESCKITA